MKHFSIKPLISVVIPAFKVKDHILGVVNSIGAEVQNIVIIDDACPEKTGIYVKKFCKDKRVEVLFHKVNLGVGGAVKSGYQRALDIGSDIIVKIDGDGQMDSSRIEELIRPIFMDEADYSKGNRFFSTSAISAMPKLRIIGNLGLSFMSKLSSGYYKILDPTNGFTAIRTETLRRINLEKIDNGYFFESDMLFRLNLESSRVKDVPIPAIYNREKSNLKIGRVLIEFPLKHLRNFCKRILYSYYLRDFSLPSIELPVGLFLLTFGTTLGIKSWIQGNTTNQATQTGTIVLVAMSCIIGFQLVLAFFDSDIKKE